MREQEQETEGEAGKEEEQSIEKEHGNGIGKRTGAERKYQNKAHRANDASS